MNNVAEQIDRQIKTGAEWMTTAREKLAPVDSPRNRMAAGLILAFLAAGAAIFMYSRRRRQTLSRRFQNVVPDSVREFPQELVA